MLSGLPVFRSWLISSRPTSLLLSGEPVCHLALGCAVLRRGMAREEKRPSLFPKPIRATWATFAPTAAFLPVASAESVSSFLGLQDQYHGTLCSDGTEPKSPYWKAHGLSSRVPPMHPRKFWLTSPHPCQWLVNNFIPTYKFFILSLMLKSLC